MDIRFINGRNEIINATNLSIKVIGKSLVGINERQEVVEIERYEDIELAETTLKNIADGICHLRANRESMLVDLRMPINAEFGETKTTAVFLDGVNLITAEETRKAIEKLRKKEVMATAEEKAKELEKFAETINKEI